MSVVKHNTYFKENDGKVYYYDAEGIKKEVPSTAFSNLQEQIDNLGSPLSYSGAQSVDELNELVDIKTGTVYTVTGNSGTLTAGGIDVQPSTEVAWAGEWFNIGKDLDNSWKQWSEDRNNIFDDYSVYIGSGNNVSSNKWNNSFVIGDKNRAYNGSYAIGKNSFANEGSYAIGQNSNAINGGLAISENSGSTAESGSISIGDNSVCASCGAISIGRNGVFAKNDSYTFGTLNSSAINHSFAIGSNLTALDAGFAIGIAEDSNHGYNSKAEGGMILTMSNRSFKGGYHDESGNFIKELWVDSTYVKTDISAIKYFDDEGNFVYNGIPYTANNLWPAFAYNGGIAIGRAVSANRSIAISPKWNGYNSNNNGILGTSASNESVAIGDNVYATEGSLVFGKNGLSATMASIGIGRMGTATNASILISNDLDGNIKPFSGKMYCYFDSATNEYKPFTAYDSVVYKNTISLNKQIYNTATNTFENIGSSTDTHLLFLNTWDGSIGWIYNGNNYSRSYFSGYYDENNNFIRVNSQSEVPSSATLIHVFSARAGKDTYFDCNKNNIFTMTLIGDSSYSSYSDNPGVSRGFTVSGYYIDKYYDYDQSEYKFRLYESCKNRQNTSNSSLTSLLSQYKALSSYINKNAYNGIVYDNVSYEDSTSSILNTTDNLVDYYVIGNQKIYPVEDSISGLTLQTTTAIDEGKTWSTNDSISIGEGLSSYGKSIAINAGGDPNYGVNGSKNFSNIQSAKPGNLVTANNYSTEYTINSFINNKINYRKNNIVTAYGKSIVLGADAKNISAGGDSIAIGNHDIDVTGKSIGIGNNIFSLNQSIVINQNALGRTPTAINQSLVIGGGGSWAQDNSFIFGEANSANNNAYVFGQGNSANGRTFAFGESNYIATGKSFALGYSNYINGSTEACTIGYRNYLVGDSMQHVVMGYDNYMSVYGYALHLIGNRNSASCECIYGSVLGNWNMLSHGKSLLAIHGDNNSAFGSLGEANIFGDYNVVGGGGNRISVIGYDNGRNAPGSYGSYDGIVIGNNNNWNGGSFKTSIIGINNIISGINYSDMSLIGNDNFVSADEDGVILGNNNYINSYQYNNVNSTRNHIIGNNNTASGYASMNSILLGSFNRVFYGQNITIGEYNSASDQSYVIGTNNTANITGDNIGFGIHNKIGYEAISIGKNNISLGHSIIFGWNNTTEENYIDKNNNYAHTILIGNQNSTKNTQQYIYSKSYPYISQKILSEGEIKQIQTEITELEEQRTTAYQNSANKANEIYSLLTANGLDSVSAENYINGTLYNSGYDHVYIYPYTPWAIQSYPYGISYEENGTWYTGYGESAYIKRWIYNTSSYSSNDTSDYYYRYYWLPAKQASATWSIVSSIYTAQYGSDSANRYNAVNTAIQHVNDLSQAIYTKQNKLTENPITASGTTDSHNIETMSLVVGQGNSADHHNSIVIGSENHTLKMLNTNITGDDGFTVAIGVGNTVARNYDMAIGYGSVAYGGENIAIGGSNTYVDYNWNYYNTRTNAVGLRNISIRSTLTGFDNMACISYIGGTCISSNIDQGMTGYWDGIHTNFERNQLFDFVGDINGAAYAINNNKFDYVRSNLDIANTFDRNNLRVVLSSNISANTATENTYNNFKIVNMTAYLDNNNIYNNVVYSTLTFNGITNNNIFSNVDCAKLTQQNGYSLDHNLFYNINNINSGESYWFNKFDFTANNDFSHNLIIQSNISGSNNEWPGVTNNLLYKSYLEIYNPSDKNENAINGYKECFTENVLIGTEAYGQVQESFSFGALDGSKVYRTTNYGDLEAPVLRDDFRVFNFGDNRIQHSFDTIIAGSKNDLNGVNRFVVMGGGNAVSSNAAYEGSNIGSHNNFHDSVILGTNNLIATPNSAYYGYLNTQNYILGHANTIVVNSNNGDYKNSNSNLRIIGLDNHFANIPSDIIESIITGGSIYSFTVYAQGTTRNVTRYDSIIPVKASTGHGSTYYNSYSGYAISGVSRNTIIGSHSVIASNITDSTTIGLYNTIYQNDQPHDEKFSDINLIGAFNLGLNGSHQFNVGFNNITSGHHSTAIGEELRANAFQTILGKYNTSAEGTTRTTMRWNSATNTVEQVENTGVLLAIGNGRLNLYEKYFGMYEGSPVYNWYDENNNLVDEKYITTDNYIQRSNAMIVSADGTVSARRFIESEPALTITGGDYVSVTEDTTNNKLVIDLESSLGQMLTELSGVLTAKPTTGRHILGVDDGGTLTWLEVNQ